MRFRNFCWDFVSDCYHNFMFNDNLYKGMKNQPVYTIVNYKYKRLR